METRDTSCIQYALVLMGCDAMALAIKSLVSLNGAQPTGQSVC